MRFEDNRTRVAMKLFNSCSIGKATENPLNPPLMIEKAYYLVLGPPSLVSLPLGSSQASFEKISRYANF